ncbi:MAG: hypothetical protein EXS31_07890 [Pedosphaera sp.]|nr:hypothetical protein [Pedosphaera sp.]
MKKKKKKPASPKSSSLKALTQAVRDRYTWHLRPPFADDFDHDHWWEGRKTIAREAALYELVRRHPLVGEAFLRRLPTREDRAAVISQCPDCPREVIDARLNALIHQRLRQHKEPRPIHWTCRMGLKSWAMLNYIERENWKCSIGFLKGLDFRWEELLCRSINELADSKIRDLRGIALGDKTKGKRPGEEIGEIINADLAANPPTADEWDAAIASQAVQAYRQGYLLMAVASDLEVDRAVSLMDKVYRRTRRRYASPKQRARWEDWLPLISSFEDSQMNQGAYAQEFAHYRRALDSIRFE